MIKGQIRFVVISGNKKMYRFDLNEYLTSTCIYQKQSWFQGLKKECPIMLS